MKKYFFKPLLLVELILLGFVLLAFSQASTDKCGIQVVKSYNQELLGKNVGFFVVFKNNSAKNMDAIDYKITFLNGFDEVKGTQNFKWQAGNFFGPKLPGESLKDGSTTWVSEANKVKVSILRVHFTDGSSCK